MCVFAYIHTYLRTYVNQWLCRMYIQMYISGAILLMGTCYTHKCSSPCQVVEEPQVEDRRLRRLREAQESSLSRYVRTYVRMYTPLVKLRGKLYLEKSC